MCAKILFILMPEQFQDHEFNIPFSSLIRHSHHVDVAGFKPGIATGTFGLEVTPNRLLPSLTPQDFLAYDALVIPGGAASTIYLWHNERIQEIIRLFHENKKLVATICYACIAPVQTGILTNKKATVYPTDEAKAVFKEFGVEFVDKGCVVLFEEKIITAQGPTFAREFGQEIIKTLDAYQLPTTEKQVPVSPA